MTDAPPTVERALAAPPDTPAPAPARRWPRRLLIGALLVFAFGVLFVTGRNADTDGRSGDLDPVIVTQTPPPGGRALRQSEVGAMLQPGYDGRLTINGIDIPEGQMVGAIDPSTVTPAQLKKYGLRPNNRNTVMFQPGPGKILESLPSGQVQVVLRYFRDLRNQNTGRTVTWTFNVD